MEQFGGSEIFRKDDRMFGSMQGSQYQSQQSGRGNIGEMHNRRKRIMGSSSYSSAFSNLQSRTLEALEKLIVKYISDINTLYSRQSTLGIMLRFRNQRYGAIDKIDGGGNISFSEFFNDMLTYAIKTAEGEGEDKASLKDGGTETKVGSSGIAKESSKSVVNLQSTAGKGILSISPYDAFIMGIIDKSIHSNSNSSHINSSDSSICTDKTKSFEKNISSEILFEIANNFSKFFRFTLYRGDPYSVTGLEQLALDDMDAAGVKAGKIRVTLDQILDEIMKHMLTSDTSNRKLSTSQGTLNLKDEFSTIFLNMSLQTIAKNVHLACAPRYVDHCWADPSYLDDVDDDCIEQPNLHYAQWVSNTCIKLGRPEVTYSVFRIWSRGLKGPSMSLKQVCEYVDI